MSFQNRIRINRQVILRRAWTWTGVAMTVLCFVALFVPMTELIPEKCPIVCKVLTGCAAFIALFVLLAFASAVRVLFTNKVCVLTKAGHHVYVQYGDVFSHKVVGKKYKGKRKIVIDVNRCFDTIVDDHLVSHRTLHGQLFQRFYDEGKFDEESLNKTIQDSLAGKPYQLLTTAVKPKGNLRRYEAGTVAELKDDDQVSYYLLGLSPFDENLNSDTDNSDLVNSVQGLIEFCYQRAQAYPVVLPLLGAGMANLNLEESEILRYLVSAFELNKNRLRCDFHIVVWDKHKDLVPIDNL